MAAAHAPDVLDFCVTDYCDADCDFCGFARSRMRGKPLRFADSEAFARALPILAQRGFRYLNFQGRVAESIAATIAELGRLTSLGRHRAGLRADAIA